MQGHFGSYGGTFVAETLIAALEELRDQYEYYRNDVDFQQEYARELKFYVGTAKPYLSCKEMVGTARRRTDLIKA